MTDTEIRIACAEACGWKRDKIVIESVVGPTQSVEGWRDINGNPSRRIPDYPNDLNACRQFEEILTDTEFSQYHDWMYNLMDKYKRHPVIAVELQRCEAFLRMKRLWKE